MGTTCLDKIYCENAWDCSITVLDTQGNPIDPLLISNNQNIVVVLGDKPGYEFWGFMDETGTTVRFMTRTDIGANAYQLFNVQCSHQYFVKYCPIQYTIEWNSDNQTCMPDYVRTTATYGTVVQITASEGYRCRFLNWTRNVNGEDVVVSEELSFPYVVTEDATFTAHYDEILYRLTVKPFNQNQGACTGSGNYALGTTVQITASPKQNHFFKEWDDGDTNSTRDVVINGNRTYVAHFTYKEQVVTSPSVSGGYATGGGTYRSGDVATMQAIAQPGWRFSHWLADGVIYEGEKYSFVVTGDTTIIPVFTPNTYTVYLTPSPMGGGYFTSSNQQPSYEYGDTVTYTAIPVYGYEFVSWDDGVTTPQRTFTITANVRMNAVFATKTASHTVTIVLPDSSYVCPVYYNGQDIGYKQNTTVTATAPEGAILRLDPATPDGQVLVSVTDSDSNVVWSSTSREAIEYTVGDSDEELTLNYQNLEYDLRVTLQPTNQYTLNSGMFNVSIDGNGSYYQPTQQEPMRLYSGLAYGTPIVLTAPLYMGSYIFSHWVTDVGSFGTYTVSFGMVKDIKCIAVYSENAI